MIADKHDIDTHLRLLQFAADEQNAEREYELKKREIALREQESAYKAAELQLREREYRRAHWFNPLSLGVIAASLTLFGNMVVSREQEKTMLAQERIKSQSNVILEAIRTGDPERAAKNLEFFIALGFIDDPTGRIKTYLANRQNIPVLPAELRQALEHYDVRNIVREILSAAGVEGKDIEVKIVNDSSANAYTFLDPVNHNPVVAINKAFLEDMNRNLNINWGSVFVLAHEIGHVVLGHLHSGPDKDLAALKSMELAADRFSGSIMCRLGASLSDVTGALTNVPDVPDGVWSRQNSRADRLAAALAGCSSISHR